MTTKALIATAVLTATIKEKDLIVQGLGTAEAGASTFLHGAIDKFNPGGLVGVAVSVARPAIEAELDTLINQYGPEELYGVILEDVTAWAKDQGATLPVAV